MKHSLLSTLVILSVAAAGNGCAHFSKTSVTTHVLVKYGAAVPPDWRVVEPVGGLALPGNETNAYAEFAFTGETNTAAGLLANGPRIFVAYRESWTDRSRGGGTFLFTDPAASQVASGVTNQAALGGAHTFQVGNVSSTITTNAVSAITAGGTAVGNVIGAAASAAAGK